MKIRKLDSYKVMPWKNGGGITTEMVIEPRTAQFPKDDFLWRLSSAEIRSKNSFSQFPGYDRILFVIKGDGLLIKEKYFINGVENSKSFELKPLTAFSFHGETSIDSDLIAIEVDNSDGKFQANKDFVLDLGLIFKRDKAQASSEILSSPKPIKNHTLSLKEGLHLLVCIEGLIFTEGLTVDPMNTLEITGPCDLKIDSQTPSTVIHFSIISV